jgi:hypothetical protein
MQDVATPHTTKETIRELRGVFLRTLMGRIELLARVCGSLDFPDLNLCIFSFVGNLKSCFYANNLHDLEALKHICAYKYCTVCKSRDTSQTRYDLTNPSDP